MANQISFQIKDGHVIDWINDTGAAVPVGTIVAIGGVLGRAEKDIAIGATGAVKLDGEFELPAVSGAVIGVGERMIYIKASSSFDDSSATAATGDVSNGAFCTVAKIAGTTKVQGILTKGTGTVT